MLKTHSDFKSIIKNIKNANDIYEKIGEILERHIVYKLVIGSDEKYHLETFEIILDRIDRLYFLDCNEYEGIKQYDIIGRMDYYIEKEWRKLYFEIVASSLKNICNSGCMIFASFDDNLFMEVVSLVDRADNERLLTNFLYEDGVSNSESIKYKTFSTLFKDLKRILPGHYSKRIDFIRSLDIDSNSDFIKYIKTKIKSESDLKKFIRYIEAKMLYNYELWRVL